MCYLKFDMTLLNGFVVCEFGDVGLFKNGLRDGVHKEWYENGVLKKEWTLVNGV